MIRPWAARDASPLAEAYSDEQIQQWHARSMTVSEAHAWATTRELRWRAEVGADWAVTQNGRLAGRVGLRTMDPESGQAEVAYWVIPHARRRGIATRAVGALSSWAFDTAGFHRLDLRHSVRNAASCRAALRCGFVVEGIARSSALHPDGWHDMHLHARITTAGA